MVLRGIGMTYEELSLQRSKESDINFGLDLFFAPTHPMINNDKSKSPKSSYFMCLKDLSFFRATGIQHSTGSHSIYIKELREEETIN